MIPDLRTNIDPYTYPIVAAFYFGFMNVLALLLGEYFGWSLFQRLVVITIISIVVVSTFITIKRHYPWTDQSRWIRQYGLIAAGHSIAFLVVIYGLYLAIGEPD